MVHSGDSHRKWIIIGGAILLIVLLVFVDLNDLVTLFRAINWLELLGAAGVLLIGCLLLTVRLRYLLFNQPGWWETFYANSIGYMLHITLFAPAMIARAVTTGWITSVSLPQASSAILIERLLEQVMRLLAMMLVIVLLTAQQTHPTISISGSLVLLIVVFGAVFWIMHHRKQVIDFTATKLGHFKYFNEEQVRQAASSMLEGLETISSARRLSVSVILSLLAWSSFFVFQYLVLNALPLDLSVSQMLLIAAAVLAVMPPSINVMLIVYQIVVALLLITFQLTGPTVAITYAVILHLIQMICWIILGRWSLTQTNFNFKHLVETIRQHAEKRQNTSQEGKA